MAVIDAMLKLENLSGATQRKHLLERAAYLCIVMKDFKRASTYQSTLVSLCEKLYLLNSDTSLPHPLLGFHYYQQGKLLSQSEDFKGAVEALHKASLILGAYYGIKSTLDGKMINERLVHEINENYLANV